MTFDSMNSISRRKMLKGCCAGFGALALDGLIGRVPAFAGLPGKPHFAPHAKRIIFLFMHGGPSQVDTFDYKPRLIQDDGKPLPYPLPRVTFASPNQYGGVMRSPWEFRQHGESGQWVSELFPHVAGQVDDICFVKSLHGTNDAHGGALLALHTGSDTFVRPSMGSWMLYGLGEENSNLPGFITICPTLGHGGVNNWSSAFLPARYQGTPIGHAGLKARDATIHHLDNDHWQAGIQKLQLDLLVCQHKAIRVFFYAYVFQSLRLYLLGGFLGGGFRWPRRRLRGDGCIAHGLSRVRRLAFTNVLAASTTRKQRHHTYSQS